jgi:hypothetical protein
MECMPRHRAACGIRYAPVSVARAWFPFSGLSVVERRRWVRFRYSLSAPDPAEDAGHFYNRVSSRMMTLLIIEDEGPIRELLVEVLEDEGYLVQSVSNGQEALAALRILSKLPKLIVLD